MEMNINIFANLITVLVEGVMYIKFKDVIEILKEHLGKSITKKALEENIKGMSNSIEGLGRTRWISIEDILTLVLVDKQGNDISFTGEQAPTLSVTTTECAPVISKGTIIESEVKEKTLNNKTNKIFEENDSALQMVQLDFRESRLSNKDNTQDFRLELIIDGEGYIVANRCMRPERKALTLDKVVSYKDNGFYNKSGKKIYNNIIGEAMVVNNKYINNLIDGINYGKKTIDEEGWVVINTVMGEMNISIPYDELKLISVSARKVDINYDIEYTPYEEI